MNDDFRDVLTRLLESGSRFLVVGAHALAAHGVPRATGDLDIWIARNPGNAERTWDALVHFGAPMVALGLSAADFGKPDAVVQIGLPPRRIDVLTDVTGLSFDAAWPNRVVRRVSGLDVPFLGRDDLIKNKRATGRHRDLADIEALEGGGEG